MKKLLTVTVALLVLLSSVTFAFEGLTGEAVKDYLHSCQRYSAFQGDSIELYPGTEYAGTLELLQVRSQELRVRYNSQELKVGGQTHGDSNIQTFDNHVSIRLLTTGSGEHSAAEVTSGQVTRRASVEVCIFPEEQVIAQLLGVPVEFVAGESQVVAGHTVTFLNSKPKAAVVSVDGVTYELSQESHGTDEAVTQEVASGLYAKALLVSNSPMGDLYDKATVEFTQAAGPAPGYQLGQQVTLAVGKPVVVAGHTLALKQVTPHPVYQAGTAHVLMDGQLYAVLERGHTAEPVSQRVGDLVLTVVFTSDCDVDDSCDKAVVRLDSYQQAHELGLYDERSGKGVREGLITAPRAGKSGSAPQEDVAEDVVPEPEEPAPVKENWWQRLVKFLFG